jgi:DNA-binding GntR family transcriptional regulator
MGETPGQTAVDRAYRTIRDGIFEGLYKPGFHLKEEQFSSSLGISRTPVRQAMRMLVSEGLVEIRDNRRSYVGDVNEAEVEAVFDILAALESQSAALAALEIDRDGIAELVRIQDAMEDAGLEDDRSFLQLNLRFHSALHSHSGSRVLQNLIGQVSNYPILCYLKVGKHTENETAAREHREIINALNRRDPQYAALKMRMHVETVRRQYRDSISALSLDLSE